MPVYQARPRKGAYGYSVGILLPEQRGAFPPGDLSNAATFDFPVFYKVVPGASGERLARGDPELEPAVIAAAHDLERQGVKAITSASTFFIHFQNPLVESVRVPVLTSSLLQLPIISSFLGRDRAIGIIAQDAQALGNRVLPLTGVDPGRKLVLRGLDGIPNGEAAGGLEAAVVRLAQEMVEQEPSLGALLLESPAMPACAKAVQTATALPVFDFMTMIRTLRKAGHQQAYAGYY